MLLLLLLAFFLLFLNALFVAAEFAIVKVRHTQIEPLATQGSWRAKLAQQVVKKLDSYLSATQLGITLTSLGLGWIGEPVFSRLLHAPLELLGVTDPRVMHTISFVAGFLLLT